jgi:enoyl-CoA hydratase/carnithine racemase
MDATPRFDCLALSGDGPVRTLTLDRPNKLNALSRRLLGELVTACRWLDDQPEVKVVVVRGAGRAFSAGFDLADFADTGPDAPSPADTAELGRRATDALSDVRPLTIAAIHGHCVGGGVVLAAACDLRLAAASARFSIPEVDLGIPLGWGGIPRLVRELGPAITKELVLTCRPFDAAEARDLRLVNRVVPDAELDGAVAELAASLAAKPAYALRATKEQVDAVAEEMAGTRRNAADRELVAGATHDPEARATALAYLEARSRPPR